MYTVYIKYSVPTVYLQAILYKMYTVPTYIHARNMFRICIYNLYRYTRSAVAVISEENLIILLIFVRFVF